MSIKTIFNFLFGLILALFILTAYSAYEFNVSLDMEHKSNIRRQQIKQLGIDLAKGSDYLTNEIRSYVQFGDQVHLEKFWYEVRINKSRDRAVTKLRKLGVSQEDFDILQKAKSYSDNLIRVENAAMEEVANGDSCKGILRCSYKKSSHWNF